MTKPDSSTSSGSRPAEEIHRLQQRLAHVAHLATVSELSSGIAHEFNQPLTAIANYAQACDRLLGMPDPDINEVRDALKQITAQAMRAGETIQRLRTLARADVTKREPTDINELIGELTQLVELDAKASANKVHYRLELAAQLPPAAADRTQVQQVILNLVRNSLEALAHTAGESPEILVRTSMIPGEGVEIAVSDNGPGVSPAILPHLFNPFWTSKPHGTGLGLAVSRTIIKSHRGTLDYRSNVPSGACFTVRIPFENRDET